MNEQEKIQQLLKNNEKLRQYAEQVKAWAVQQKNVLQQEKQQFYQFQNETLAQFGQKLQKLLVQQTQLSEQMAQVHDDFVQQKAYYDIHLAQAEQHLSAQRSEYVQNKQKLNHVNQQIEYKNMQLSQLQQEIDSSIQQQQDFQVAEQSLQNTLAELNEQIEAKNAQLSQLQHEISSSIQQQRDFQVAEQSLQKILASLNQEIESKNTQLAEYQRKIDEAHIQFNSIEDNIKQKYDEYQCIGERIVQKQQELTELESTENKSIEIIEQAKPISATIESMNVVLPDSSKNTWVPKIKKDSNVREAIQTEFSRWLSKFFLETNENQRPLKADGRPLYAYELNDTEYKSLLALFHQNSQIPKSSESRYVEWCACYCLAASEVFRREYDGGHWKWDFINNQLRIDLIPADRSAIVNMGMNYWRREIPKMADGSRYYLGTFLRECGLPLKLLQEENNRFSKVIEQGIEYYQVSQKSHRPLREYLDHSMSYLSSIFKDNIDLFEETVHVLMRFAQRYPLNQYTNPADYLDEYEPDWRKKFPFSVQEEQANLLVQKWLGNAVEVNQQWQNERFSCYHTIANENVFDGQLRAHFRLPEKFTLKLNGHYVGRTVLQWQVFEGNQAVQHLGGTVFAEWHEAQNLLTLKFGKHAEQTFIRQDTSKNVSVKLFCVGELLKEIILADSQFDTQTAWLFESYQELKYDDANKKWRWMASADYLRIGQGDYVLRLPENFVLQEEAEHLADNWYRISGSLKAHDNEGNIIIVDCREQIGQSVALRGKWLPHFQDVDGLPIYRGFPILETPNDLRCVRVRLGQQDYDYSPNLNVFGTFQVAFFAENGVCLLRKRISVLPTDFVCEIQAQDNQCIIDFRSNERLNYDVLGENVNIVSESANQFLVAPQGDEIPEPLTLCAGSLAEQYAVRMRCLFPFYGAKMYNEQQELQNKNTIFALDQLTDKYINVYAPNVSLTLTFELARANIHETIDFNFKSPHHVIYLQSFKSQLRQMLSCCNDQDAVIVLRLQPRHNQNSWLTIQVKNYNGVVMWNNQTINHGRLLQSFEHKKEYFVVKQNAQDELALHNVDVAIMRLDEPNTQHRLPESQYLANRHYEISREEYGEGLWLIYPATTSAVFFRPSIFSTFESDDFRLPENNVHMVDAVRAFHSKTQPDAFDGVINDMANDVQHDGWEYLAILKRDYAHLPLSAFEVWKALVKNEHAIALAVLRLHLDELFCERIRHELAFVWEWLSVDAWQHAIQQYQPLFNQIQEAYISVGMSVMPLSQQIPLVTMCRNEDLRQHMTQGYITTPLNRNIISDVMEKERQELLRVHADDKWLRDLQPALKQWVDKQKDLPIPIQWRTLDDDHLACLMLPIFIAYVKNNRAKVKELRQTSRHGQFLYDFYRQYHFDENWFNYICAMLTSYLIGTES